MVIVFEGWDAAGKGTIINRLSQVLDPRGSRVHPIFPPNKDERFHPWLWRFWEKTPAAGQFAIFDHSWYLRVLQERVAGTVSRRQWDEAYDEIQQFERQLVDAGTVIVKVWLHIDKKEQKRRFKYLCKTKATAWKVGKEERRQYRKHGQWVEAVEEMLQRTSTAEAPWTVVEAMQGRYRRVKCFETVVDAVEKGTATSARQPATRAQTDARATTIGNRRNHLARPARLQACRSRAKNMKASSTVFSENYSGSNTSSTSERIPAIIAYEGIDAGGKGGSIKRLTRGLDPRGYEVVPIAAPDQRRKSPPLPLAVLARGAQGRPYHNLRPDMVRTAACRTSGRILRRG